MSNTTDCPEIEINQEPNKTDYVQMVTNLSLTFSLLLIFAMKILKFIFYKKKYNLKHDEIISRSESRGL